MRHQDYLKSLANDYRVSYGFDLPWQIPDYLPVTIGDWIPKNSQMPVPLERATGILGFLMMGRIACSPVELERIMYHGVAHRKGITTKAVLAAEP
jgi:hypothetical protein